MTFHVKLYAEDRTVYVPEFRNNRELAEEWDGTGEKPFFWVELLPLSGRDLNKATGIELRGAKAGRDIIKRSERVVKRIITEYVPEVGGLTLETEPGKVVRPVDGKSLYEALLGGFAALGSVVDDIFEALKDNARADEGDLKKLRRRSDSSEQKGAPSAKTGNAIDAPTPLPSLTANSAPHETATG